MDDDSWFADTSNIFCELKILPDLYLESLLTLFLKSFWY